MIISEFHTKNKKQIKNERMKRLLMLIFLCACFSIIQAQNTHKKPKAKPIEKKENNFNKEILRLTNNARSKSCKCGNTTYNSTSQLVWNDTLAKVALEHIKYLTTINELTHTGKGGSSSSQRVTKAGYVWRTVGENLALGQGTAEEAIQTWLESENHCKNMMNPSFKEFGAAFIKANSNGYFWIQVFATKM